MKRNLSNGLSAAERKRDQQEAARIVRNLLQKQQAGGRR
jgi:hypothetical protein